ncbi:MAG: formylglycine-generating enzyme family protein [Planctomycetota bacterium]|jgi:sulfatase modifying factor 1|nr:formylglycine-generating enzyme family protein [Planctomycetota bacterium]
MSFKDYKVITSLPDPAVVTDAVVRDRIAMIGRPWKIRHKASDIVLLLVPDGTFMMGSPADEAGRGSDEKQHKRVIRQPFYLGEKAVSQAEWGAILGRRAETPDDLDRPIDTVSWNDCKHFVETAGGELRLPSEAEWEYACRAGTKTAFSFGSSVTPSQVYYGGGDFPAPYKPVKCGSLPANQWGFREMHGNVWEWCEDMYGQYPDEGTEAAEMVGDGSGGRVARGGCWYFLASTCRGAYRGSLDPKYANDFFGVRVAKSLD